MEDFVPLVDVVGEGGAEEGAPDLRRVAGAVDGAQLVAETLAAGLEQLVRFVHHQPLDAGRSTSSISSPVTTQQKKKPKHRN